MHKAGGFIALIAGFFSIAAAFFVGVFSAVSPMIDPDAQRLDGGLYLLGGLFVASVVIILSAIILFTRSRVPGILLIAFSVFAIYFNIGSGFVTICLVFAIIGGLFALARD